MFDKVIYAMVVHNEMKVPAYPSLLDFEIILALPPPLSSSRTAGGNFSLPNNDVTPCYCVLPSQELMERIAWLWVPSEHAHLEDEVGT